MLRRVVVTVLMHWPRQPKIGVQVTILAYSKGLPRAVQSVSAGHSK
jgi:hypothetical protein